MFEVRRTRSPMANGGGSSSLALGRAARLGSRGRAGDDDGGDHGDLLVVVLVVVVVIVVDDDLDVLDGIDLDHVLDHLGVDDLVDGGRLLRFVLGGAAMGSACRRVCERAYVKTCPGMCAAPARADEDSCSSLSSTPGRRAARTGEPPRRGRPPRLAR